MDGFARYRWKHGETLDSNMYLLFHTDAGSHTFHVLLTKSKLKPKHEYGYRWIWKNMSDKVSPVAKDPQIPG